MVLDDDHADEEEQLESREPSLEDVVALCDHLNEQQARYIVIGGFAMRAAGYDRRTMDIDLLIETGEENERRVFAALESLPDKAVRQLTPGEVAQYAVIRVADEIVVDLMKAACGITYQQALPDAIVHEVDGVAIPFASPRLLWRTKCTTHRAKDMADLQFLGLIFERQGQSPPDEN